MSKMSLRFGNSLLVVAALGMQIGCSKDEPKQLAPKAEALKAEPAPAMAMTLAVQTESSAVTFLMDSPLEKIDGDAPKSVSGELFVDTMDLAKSTGLVKVDLQKLTLYQQKRADEKGEYSTRAKNDLQNTHARDWLQIVAHEGEVTAAQAEENRWVEFKIEKLSNLSATNVAQLTGSERKVTATVTGPLRLHGRKAEKSAKVELTFKYQESQLTAVSVKTLEPFAIPLEEFEVHPRDAAGKFVKTLADAVAGSLKGKLAKEAPVSISFTAAAK
ncbi:MAG TPA: hypothetical protein VHO25_23800 [Polyangiaceae bacterium]|nr:hypothetical protein [Polyangiaceae bacterium]